MNPERDEMNEHLSELTTLILRIDGTCAKVHTKSSGMCGLGTDCPFHAAFEENTVYGCRLAGLKDIMEKRKRRREYD